MNWIAIVEFINKILDRLPSRRESIQNRIQEIKDEQKKMQNEPWTDKYSTRYYLLAAELYSLERRARNVGL